MKISTPEIKVIRFSSEDVIAASSSLTGSKGYFYIPSEQFSGFSGSGDYVGFNGTIGSQTNRGYLIENYYETNDYDPESRAAVMTRGSYGPMPESVMEKMARNTYDAFSYNGQYYTNGISYYDQFWKQQ